MAERVDKRDMHMHMHRDRGRHQRKHIENASSKRKSKLEEYKARVSCQLVWVLYRNTTLPFYSADTTVITLPFAITRRLL